MAFRPENSANKILASILSAHGTLKKTYEQEEYKQSEFNVTYVSCKRLRRDVDIECELKRSYASEKRGVCYLALDSVEFKMKKLGVNGQIITGTTSIVGYYEATLKIDRE